MIRRRRSAGHGSLRTITPTRAAFARPGPGGYPFPGVIARMQPSDSLIPIGLGSGRPLPSAYPGARATRSNEGLPGVRAVLFQRAVVVDPAGCGALLAHGAGPAVAFRLHEALGTQEDVVSRLQGLRPTRSRTYASATALPRSPQGSLPAWVGWPLTGRGSHPLDDTQGFMTYSSIPLDRPAWPHHAPTPQASRTRSVNRGNIDSERGCRDLATVSSRFGHTDGTSANFLIPRKFEGATGTVCQVRSSGVPVGVLVTCTFSIAKRSADPVSGPGSRILRTVCSRFGSWCGRLAAREPRRCRPQRPPDFTGEKRRTGHAPANSRIDS